VAEFLQQVVSGLATGGIYASLALALVLVYRSSHIVNFAQGELATLSTYVAWQLIDWGLPFWGAFSATLAISLVGGALLYRLVIARVEGAPVLVPVMVTIGLLILVGGVVTWIWGGETRVFPPVFSTRPIQLGGVSFSIQDIGFIGLSLGAVGLLYLLFQRTKLGLGLRAAAFAPEPARLLGVRVPWLVALGWGIAAALGALAGMMTAPTAELDPNMMRPVLLYAFAAAVIGGLDSPLGAVVGGLALGVALNLIGRYVDFAGVDLGGQMRIVVGLALILLVLLVRPRGLLGRGVGRKV
jgi:branched-chain amino acid transport system permease protein